MSIPIAQSTPVMQASQIPVVGTTTGRDIVQPISSEGARAKYLEGQMKGYGWHEAANEKFVAGGGITSFYGFVQKN